MGKRRRPGGEEDSHDEGEEAEEVEEDELLYNIVNDTMEVFKSLETEMYNGRRGLVLQHQLYCRLNKTKVDQELRDLMEEGHLRGIRMPSRRHETGLVSMDCIRALITLRFPGESRDEGEGPPGGTAESRAWLLSRELIEKRSALSLEWADIEAAAQSVAVAAGRETWDWGENPSKSLKTAVDIIVKKGFLMPRRDISAEGAYWFSVPKLGATVTSLDRGRSEVEQIFKRLQYKEMPQAKLLERKLRKSSLSMAFHIRDLVGLGMLKAVTLPNQSVLLQLVQD